MEVQWDGTSAIQLGGKYAYVFMALRLIKSIN
jgi:hypothetical protein